MRCQKTRPGTVAKLTDGSGKSVQGVRIHHHRSSKSSNHVEYLLLSRCAEARTNAESIQPFIEDRPNVPGRFDHDLRSHLVDDEVVDFLRNIQINQASACAGGGFGTQNRRPNETTRAG